MLKEEELKKEESLGSSRFTFNGNIIAEIGEESISNPNIAIAELIKNSYDADATRVEVKFDNLGKHNSKIIILDDGVGMDYSEIKDRWMDIGSPHKSEIQRTEENNRIPVGAKGIGRFASHCLGTSLKLITASKDERYGHKLTFDWEKFSPKVQATDVDNDTVKFRKKVSMRGTTLVIENLKQQWHDRERLKKLLRDIYLLTSPINSPKNFRLKENISVHCDDLKKIGAAFLEKAAYHLDVKLTRKREIRFEFYKNNVLKKKEKKELKEELNCGDVSFDLYFYYKLASKWERYLGKSITSKDAEEIDQMLEEYGGIKLYRDCFRVKPYGDPGADWIGLDKWSRDQSMVPGNTQVIGIVSISRETNPEIEDTTTREGVINNSQYFDLTKFVTSSIRLFVSLRSEEEIEKAKARKIRKKGKKSEKKMEVIEPKVGEIPSKVQEAPFINVKGSFPSNHYDQPIFEANECENKNLPNAAFWLSRKIVENLVFHILERKFPKKKELWYDTANKRNQSLSKLIDNLFQNRHDFDLHVEEYIVQFKSDVGKFKLAVDAAIHKNYAYLTEANELKQYKINKIIQLLIEIYGRI